MDPDDLANDSIEAIIANITVNSSKLPNANVDDFFWAVTGDGSDYYSSPNFKIYVDQLNDNDSSYGVVPMDNEPAIYTSYEQREQHDKYPALQKLWEDYLAMYALTKGDPPIVD